ncbi:MAG: MinD/ParA family protein [Candidatus Bathyarchaeia archaeon]
MAKIIAVHSFRGGTGKSIIVASLSVSFAEDGYNVCAVDSDITNPSLHILYGLGDKPPYPTLSEHLIGKCEFLDMVKELKVSEKGRLYLIPANLNCEAIKAFLREGYSYERLNNVLQEIEKKLAPDVVLMDVRPGLDDKTMLILERTHLLLLVLRNDRVDLLGTGIALEFAKYFDIPKKYLVPNMISKKYDFKEVKEKIEELYEPYKISVLEVLPESRKLQEYLIKSPGIFIKDHPNDIFSKGINKLRETIKKRLVDSKMFFRC